MGTETRKYILHWGLDLWVDFRRVHIRKLVGHGTLRKEQFLEGLEY